MATGIPTFRVDIAEGMIDVDTSADRLFAYCVEADKGPVNIPTFVASNKEALRIFGVDFAPHFYQNPTGLVINRVGFTDMAKGKIEYQGTVGNATKTVLVIEATSPGPCKHKVKIAPALVGDGLSLTVDIDGVTSKNYQNLRTLKKVAERINNRFSEFLTATLTSDYNEATFDNTTLVTSETGALTGGTNGYMLNANGQKAGKTTGEGNSATTTHYEVSDVTYGVDGTSTAWKTSSESTAQQIEAANAEPNPETTRIKAYQEAFDKTSYVDVIGVAALSDSEVVRNVLIEHINYMVDPEVHSFRFGVTSLLTSDAQNGVNSIDSIKGVAEFINSEWIICIGQGVIFQKENEAPVELKPYQAIQLYTGIRSSLGYSEAIFGGEPKKVLRGVIDTLPLVNDGTTIIKDDVIELNEAGICTFKKEYDEITFVEGVTTIQDEDVMSYENMMSIIAYVVKRLVRIAKPYQGQRLTEDLKSTLQTALAAELRTITESDGTLMALEDFNIPPYDVQVYSAAKTKFDETNRLVRESKIIIQCRIVPVGALRDIDLHVIAI